MRRGRPPYPDLLTPREQEVLELLRDGLTNRQIAHRLGISYNGARFHVSEILSKLGVSTREEAAAWQGEGAGQRSRWFGFAPLPLLSGSRLSMEDVVKVGSVGAIGAAAVGGILLAAGVLIMQGRGSDSPEAALASPTPMGNAMSEMHERRMGPYVALPSGGVTAVQPERSATTPPGIDALPPAPDLTAARQSSLFPEIIPEGYSVIDAHSAGRSAEAYLEVHLTGPAGEVTIVRSYPEVMPIIVEYDPAVEEFSPFPVYLGIGFHPPGGDRSSTPARLQAMESGIETHISGDGLSIEEAGRIFREMSGRLGPLTAEHVLPAAPAPSELLAGSMTGPCSVTAFAGADYVWEGARFVVHAWADCDELVELTPCAPGSVYEVPGLQTACDASGFRVDARWTLDVEGGSGCTSSGPAYAEGTAVRSYASCRGSGAAPISLRMCVTIRDQESCIEADYSP